MLIDKGFTEGDVVTLKLISGEELIARFVSETSIDITINKPLSIMMAQGLGLIPWIFLGDKDTITLKQSHVFAMVPSKRDAAKQYLEGTTGLALS